MVQCFFFIERDENDDADEGYVRALCADCRKKGEGWFYDGQVGPWTIKCHRCKKVIYEKTTTDSQDSRR